MAKKTTAREAGTVTRAKKAVASAAETVGDALTTAKDAVKEHVVQPVAEAVGLAKPKKKAAGQTAAGKLMSGRVTAAPAKAGQSKGPAAKKAATALRKNDAKAVPRGKR